MSKISLELLRLLLSLISLAVLTFITNHKNTNFFLTPKSLSKKLYFWVGGTSVGQALVPPIEK